MKASHFGCRGGAEQDRFPDGTNGAPMTLHHQFAELVASWRAETAGLSSPRAIAGHPAYQRIIELGEPAYRSYSRT